MRTKSTQKAINGIREKIKKAKEAKMVPQLTPEQEDYLEDTEPWIEMKTYVKKEVKDLPKKRKIFDSIDKWTKEFSKKPEFKEALELDDSDDIGIYESEWGHVLAKKDPGDGAWSILYLKKNGTLRYNLTYSPDSWENEADITLNEKNLPKFTFNYLKQVKRHIISGDVYESIKDGISG